MPGNNEELPTEMKIPNVARTTCEERDFSAAQKESKDNPIYPNGIWESPPITPTGLLIRNHFPPPLPEVESNGKSKTSHDEYRETSTRVLQLLDEIFHTQSAAKKQMAQETRTSMRRLGVRNQTHS